MDRESLAWWQSCRITLLGDRLERKHNPVLRYETMLPEHTTFHEGSSSVRIFLEMCDNLTGSLPFQLPCFIKHLQADSKTCAYISKRIKHWYIKQEVKIVILVNKNLFKMYLEKSCNQNKILPLNERLYTILSKY